MNDKNASPFLINGNGNGNGNGNIMDQLLKTTARVILLSFQPACSFLKIKKLKM